SGIDGSGQGNFARCRRQGSCPRIAGRFGAVGGSAGKIGGFCKRCCKQDKILVSRNRNRAELREVAGHELCVEQRKGAAFQARDKMRERNFARVALARKHALAEKGGAQLHAIKTADQTVLAPAFDAVPKAAAVKFGVKGNDLLVDPAFLSSGS